jgi:hypothetical protein
MLVDRFFVEVLEFFFYQKIHLPIKLLFYKYINFTLKYASEVFLLVNKYKTGGFLVPKKQYVTREGFFRKKPCILVCLLFLYLYRADVPGKMHGTGDRVALGPKQVRNRSIVGL